MSRRIVGYEGEGKHRRPIYSDPLAVDLSINPPGAITRRVATVAEREGFAPRVVNPGLIRLSRRAPVTPPPAPTPVTPDPVEEPAMSIEPPPVADEPQTPDPFATWSETLGSRIAVVADAAAAAATAWDGLQAAALAERSAEAALAEAERVWDDARAALEASWRSTRIGMQPGAVSEAERRHEELLERPYAAPSRITEVLERRAARAESPADIPPIIPEPVDDSPEVITRRADPPAIAPRRQVSEPRVDGLSDRQASVVVLLMDGKTRAEAARALMVTYQTVDGLLEAAAKKGLLPAELYPSLPARFAKYATVER